MGSTSDAVYEAINRAYDAFRERDLSAILDALDEDVELDAREALLHRGVYRGHAGFTRYLATLGEAWDDLRIEADEITPSLSGHAMAVGRICGVERSSRDHIEAPFIHVLRVKGDRVRRIQVYVDREKAVREMRRQATLAGG